MVATLATLAHMVANLAHNGPDLDADGRVVGAHGRVRGAYGRILGAHGRVLGAHGRALGTHGRALGTHRDLLPMKILLPLPIFIRSRCTMFKFTAISRYFFNVSGESEESTGKVLFEILSCNVTERYLKSSEGGGVGGVGRYVSPAKCVCRLETSLWFLR